MADHLTGLEEKMLSFIGEHLRNHNRSPTLKQIGGACGVKSTGTVHRYIKSIEDKGRLERSGKGWRTLRAPGHFPFLGTVR
ncbi:MAG: hypothetical protein AAF346_00105 [Pseudomonadota bacterium]